MIRSKEWANNILRMGIRELKNKDRDKKARFLEVFTFIHYLLEEGFWWQAKVLRSQLYRHWNNLQPKADAEGTEAISTS